MNDLTVIDHETGEIASGAPLSVEAMQEELERYRAIQAHLDRVLDDCTMKIQGRLFRKKSYWRAIATWARLSVEVQEERREQLGDDVVWFVSATATAPNGRTMTGDGACAFSEKRGAMATDHNVRSHAITRAKNRAISDLVGFGEVSAEEINHDAKFTEQPSGRGEYRHEPYTRPQPVDTEVPGGMDRTLNEAEVTGLQQALAHHGKEEQALLEHLGHKSVWAVMASEKSRAWEWIKS